MQPLCTGLPSLALPAGRKQHRRQVQFAPKATLRIRTNADINEAGLLHLIAHWRLNAQSLMLDKSQESDFAVRSEDFFFPLPYQWRVGPGFRCNFRSLLYSHAYLRRRARQLPLRC